MSSPLADSPFALAREIDRRSRMELRVPRTPEAQADIAAARAPSCAHAIHQPDCPGCAVDLATAQAEQQARATERAESLRKAIEQGSPPPDLDAALSNAALADTPAMREMGGPNMADIQQDAMQRAVATRKLLERDGHIEPKRDLGPLPRMEQVIGTPVRGEVPPLPPDAIVLTGPEAEQYRALTRAARIAHETARAAQAAGATLRDAFQAFCAGIAPGKES